MKKLFLILTGLLASPAGCALTRKGGHHASTNFITEPVLAPGTPAAAQPPAGAYPTTAACRTKCCRTATSSRSTNTG